MYIYTFSLCFISLSAFHNVVNEKINVKAGNSLIDL